MRFLSSLSAVILLLSACLAWQAESNTLDAKPQNALTMNLLINQKSFPVILADNPTARAFAESTPLTVTMNDLNNNEKYHYLSRPLPAQPKTAGRIKAGDLMLFGNDCLVLFYKDFPSSYRYTRIGTVQNPQQWVQMLGNNTVTVTFSR